MQEENGPSFPETPLPTPSSPSMLKSRGFSKDELFRTLLESKKRGAAVSSIPEQNDEFSSVIETPDEGDVNDEFVSVLEPREVDDEFQSVLEVNDENDVRDLANFSSLSSFTGIRRCSPCQLFDNREDVPDSH